MPLEIGTPQEALYEAVWRTATTGRGWSVMNSSDEEVWATEADTKVDEDDLVFPVIVHMASGSFSADDSVAVLRGRG